jgi:hypothetical protein
MGERWDWPEAGEYLKVMLLTTQLEMGNPLFSLFRLRRGWVTRSTPKFIGSFVLLFAILMVLARDMLSSYDNVDPYTYYLILMFMLPSVPLIAFLVIYAKENRQEGHWRALDIGIDPLTARLAPRLRMEGFEAKRIEVSTEYSRVEDARALVLGNDPAPEFIALFRYKGYTIVHIGMLILSNRARLRRLRDIVDEVVSKMVGLEMTGQ